MGKRIYISLITLFLIIFLTSFISSAPPPFIQFTDEGYDIEIPPNINNVEILEHIIIHIHVINESTGFQIDSTTSSCDLHLYNQTGSHLIKLPMTSDGSDFELDIHGNNFSTVGSYSVIINCNDSRIGGMITREILVTPTGMELTDARSRILTSSFLILIFTTSFFLVFAIFVKNVPFKIFFTGLALAFLATTIGFSVSVWQQVFGTFGNLVTTYGRIYVLFTILIIGGGIGLFLYLVYMAITSFYKNLRGLADDKDDVDD